VSALPFFLAACLLALALIRPQLVLTLILLAVGAVIVGCIVLLVLAGAGGLLLGFALVWLLWLAPRRLFGDLRRRRHNRAARARLNALVNRDRERSVALMQRRHGSDV
jgi:hypothetical protein